MRTARDATDHLCDFVGDNASGQALRQSRLAVADALAELSNSYNWAYYYRSGKLATVAPYSTGTVQYQHSSGAFPRLVTLTGGTWPSWANLGVIRIANISYEVEDVKSPTQLTLTFPSNPGQDIAALTSFVLYQDAYPLPADFKTMYAATIATNLAALQWAHPSRWHDLVRNFTSQGVPTTMTILGHPKFFATMALCLFPYPDNLRQVDFVYEKRPREVQVWEYSTGTVSTTAGGTLVGGAGVTWTSQMIGCTLRVGADATTPPTGLEGGNPYAQEVQVLDVNNASLGALPNLRTDVALNSTAGALAYVLSDPIDIDTGAMYTAFLRCAEKHMAVKRRQKEAPLVAAAFDAALRQAKAADSRYAQRWGLDPDRYRVRWANHPLSGDQS